MAGDVDSMSADELERVLEDRDVVLLFITDDYAIHEIEYNEGRLCFLENGTYGMDSETSREVLENVATNDGQMKLVPQSNVRDEREKLSAGEYETPSDWSNDVYEEVTA